MTGKHVAVQSDNNGKRDTCTQRWPNTRSCVTTAGPGNPLHRSGCRESEMRHEHVVKSIVGVLVLYRSFHSGAFVLMAVCSKLLEL